MADSPEEQFARRCRILKMTPAQVRAMDAYHLQRRTALRDALARGDYRLDFEGDPETVIKLVLSGPDGTRLASAVCIV